jgi:hypothetical protein
LLDDNRQRILELFGVSSVSSCATCSSTASFWRKGRGLSAVKKSVKSELQQGSLDQKLDDQRSPLHEGVRHAQIYHPSDRTGQLVCAGQVIAPPLLFSPLPRTDQGCPENRQIPSHRKTARCVVGNPLWGQTESSEWAHRPPSRVLRARQQQRQALSHGPGYAPSLQGGDPRLVMEVCCALHHCRVRLTLWQPMV